MDTFGVLEPPSGPGMAVLRCVSQAHRRMVAVLEPISEPAETSSAAVVLSGAVGRPRFEVPRHQLEFLLEAGFSVPEISNLVGVSVSTVRRRMSCYSLSVRSIYVQFLY